MADEPKSESPPKTVDFHYLKSPQFRTIYVDGIIGASNPRGNHLFFGLFHERHPFPTQVTHEVVQNEDGVIKLGEELAEQRVSRSGIIRELDVAVVIDIDNARVMVNWLQKRIADLEKAKGATK